MSVYEMSAEDLLNLCRMEDLNTDGLFLDEVVELYNKCHDEKGRFCEVPGSFPRGSDGFVSGKAEVESGATRKTGPRGGSLVDPHEGTETIDGIRGYDKKGKPVPGTDAWLEAHGLSKEAFNARPYTKFEADRSDPAIQEAFAGDELAKGKKFWEQRLEQEGQDGGYIMYKSQVPDSPDGPVAPQVRPNVAVVTNAADRAYAKTILENSQERLINTKKMTPSDLRKERRADVKKAELNLERVKQATPGKIKEVADKKLADAKDAVARTKVAGNDSALVQAKLNLIDAKREHKSAHNRANNWDPEIELYDAEQGLKYTQNRLQRSIDSPKEALTAELISQERQVARNQSRFDKTAAKYVFTKGVKSARIDMSQDPQNVKNLTEGKGRIYFAMEGAIKNDAILTALKKEDPTAAVVNVPSVTLWQDKDSGAAEINWFAKKYGKGREIVLIPDADGIDNPNVMSQAKGLSAALEIAGGKNTKVILASPPLKAGTKKVIDEFELPSGVHEKRKGVDDHLGAGRGTLGQLTYQKTNSIPSYDLTEYTGKGRKATNEGPKMNASARKNTEKTLSAISQIVGPKGAAQIPKKLLAQAAGLPLTSAKDARDKLVELGIISVEHIWNEKALSTRRRRIRNPAVLDERVAQLVKNKIIKEPRVDRPFTEVSIEESPVVSLLHSKHMIKSSDIEVGTLSDLTTWHPPKTFKGWTSPIDGRSDTTGLAAKQTAQEAKTRAKKAATQPKVLKTAPKNAIIIRTAAGAKRFGRPVGSVVRFETENPGLLSMIPLELKISQENLLTSMTLVAGGFSQEQLVEFYNSCHGEDGKFCETPGGPGAVSEGSRGRNQGSVGSPVKTWPPLGAGREITTLAEARFGKKKVDGVRVKAAYEVKTANGDNIRLYDFTGKSKEFKDDMLNAQARMHEINPLNPPRDLVVIHPSQMATMSGNNRVQAIVWSHRPFTYVNSKALGYDISNERDGYSMPSSKDGNPKDMSYILTHEYGHHEDFSKNVDVFGNYKVHPLLSNPAIQKSLSGYGTTNPIEAYAEVFAEYHHSNGTTKNPAAIAFARYEKWYEYQGTAGLKASGGIMYFAIQSDALGVRDEELDLPDLPAVDAPGFAVLDNFEEAVGPKLIGDYKPIEPTEEEKALADKIVRRVFKDLNINYDEYLNGSE